MITSIFPTPIYTAPITIKQDFSNLQYVDAGNGHISQSNNVLQFYPTLKQELQDHVNKYTEQLGFANQTIISTSWVNKHYRNGYSQQHVHHNSIISGVVFIDTPPDTGLFILKKTNTIQNDLFSMHIKLDPTHPTQYNSDEYVVTPQSNSLIIFPSSIPHCVTLNNTDHPRYTMAFNVLPNGTIGRQFETEMTMHSGPPQ